MQESKPKPMSPTAEPKTAALLLDCCDFYDSYQSSVKGCIMGSVIVARVGTYQPVPGDKRAQSYQRCLQL